MWPAPATAGRGAQWLMLLPHLAPASAASATDVSTLVARVLADCLDIRSIWSIGHDPDEACPRVGAGELLAFADRATLARLRRSANLHSETIDFLVVVDGDLFENAWGVEKLSGSLARWAWRESSASEAYYDVSHWGDAGAVIRVRRKALLIWRALRSAD
jgi:hypothetical protein